MDFGFWIGTWLERLPGWGQGNRLVGRRPGPAVLFVLLAAAVAISACSLIGGNDPPLGSAQVLSGSGRLVCSEQCRERGQCGATGQGDVVLLSSFLPSTRNHDVAIQAGTEVAITQVLTETMVSAVNPVQTFLLPYYNVAAPDGSFGWTAGWCIQGP